MSEEAWTKPIALDTNLFMRHGVRRFLCATQESAGSWVVVPAEALRETCRRYHVQAGRFAKRLVEREIAQRFGPTEVDPIGWTGIAMRQRVHDRFPQSGLGILGQHFAPQAGNGLEPPGMTADEPQAAVDRFHQRTGAFLAGGGGSGTGPTPERRTSCTAAARMKSRGSFANRMAGGAQHARFQRRRRYDRHSQIRQCLVHPVLPHGGPAIGGKDLIDRTEIMSSPARCGAPISTASAKQTR